MERTTTTDGIRATLSVRVEAADAARFVIGVRLFSKRVRIPSNQIF